MVAVSQLQDGRGKESPAVTCGIWHTVVPSLLRLRLYALFAGVGVSVCRPASLDPSVCRTLAQPGACMTRLHR